MRVASANHGARRVARWREGWAPLALVLLAGAFGCEEGSAPQPAPGGSPDVAAAGAAAAPTPGPVPEQPPAPTAPAPLGKLSTDGPIRIVAVGDSITRATCWRASLWDKLNQNFASRFDFVGTLQKDNSCAPAGYDLDNQGYSSSLITEIVANITTARTCDPSCPTLADLQQALLTDRADVALLHFGTNDVWNSKNPQDIVNGYTAVVDALRAANSKVVILVAQIIPMNVTTSTCTGCTPCTTCPAGVTALNTRIVSWAAEHDSAASPIRVVDQYAGFDARTDSGDGVHPNLQGSEKMAARWYTALAPLF